MQSFHMGISIMRRDMQANGHLQDDSKTEGKLQSNFQTRICLNSHSDI